MTLLNLFPVRNLLIFLSDKKVLFLQAIFGLQHKSCGSARKKERRKSPYNCDLSPTFFHQNLEPYVSFCQFYLRKRINKKKFKRFPGENQMLPIQSAKIMEL